MKKKDGERMIYAYMMRDYQAFDPCTNLSNTKQINTGEYVI